MLAEAFVTLFPIWSGPVTIGSSRPVGYQPAKSSTATSTFYSHERVSKDLQAGKIPMRIVIESDSIDFDPGMGLYLPILLSSTKT